MTTIQKWILNIAKDIKKGRYRMKRVEEEELDPCRGKRLDK